MGKIFLILAAIFLITATALADIYKCVSNEGIVTYSDEPCSPKSIIFRKTVSLDALIVSVCPYRQAVSNSDTLTNDLLEISNKIGGYIVPDKLFNSSSVSTYDDLLSINWEVRVDFDCGRKINESNCFRIRFIYKSKKQDKQKTVWLKSIDVILWGNPYDPPAMLNIKGMRKTNIGRWMPVEK